MSARSLCAPIAIVILLSGLGRASAQAAEGDERAQIHFRAATAYYEAGDFESALHEFQSAYDLSRRPELLWNLYLVHERLGQWEQAIGALESFAQGGHPGYEREQVDTRLEHLRERIHRRQDRDRADRDADPDGDTRPPRDTTPVLAIAGFSVAAVGLAAFAVFGALALVEDDSLWSSCDTSCEGRTGTLEAYTITADVAAAVALVGATLGVIGIVIAPSSDAGAARRAPSLRVAIGAGSIAIGGAL